MVRRFRGSVWAVGLEGSLSMMYNILPNAWWMFVCGWNKAVITSLRRLSIGKHDYVTDCGADEGHAPYQDCLDDALTRRVLV